MISRIHNAWLGWRQFIVHGKLAALLLGALLFLYLGRRLESRRHRQLFRYTAVMAALCICPLTAAVLMGYQTALYEYTWIWSAVPVTVMIAFSGTVFLVPMWENYLAERKTRFQLLLRLQTAAKPIALTLLCAAVLFWCGSLGEKRWQEGWHRPPESFAGTDEQYRAQIEAVLAETVRLADIPHVDAPLQIPCIFAPSEVMEYARIYSGEITLPYGRNMWDGALNAYIYDAYSDSAKAMYRWMLALEDRVNRPWQEAQPIDDAWEEESRKCLRSALEMRVNVVIVPGGMPEEALEKVTRLLQTPAREVAGYYVFSML